MGSAVVGNAKNTEARRISANEIARCTSSLARRTSHQCGGDDDCLAGSVYKVYFHLDVCISMKCWYSKKGRDAVALGVNMTTKTPDKPSLDAHFATAADGSRLSYYSVGTGPGILILHGAVSYALIHEELAIALSPYYTVHVASRRGRGLSSKFPPLVTELVPTYDSPTSKGGVGGGGVITDRRALPDAVERSPDPGAEMHVGDEVFPRIYRPDFTSLVIATEVSDLEALIAATGAEFIFSISSGALITLQAFLRDTTSPQLSCVKKVIIFEPPILFTDRPSSCNYKNLPRFEKELAENSVVDAAVTAMHLVELGPTWIPRWLMCPLSTMMFRAQDKSAAKRLSRGEPDRGIHTMSKLIPMLRYDFAVVEGMIQPSLEYARLGQRDGGQRPRAEFLLLSAARSPLFLLEGMKVLEEIIQGAKTVEIQGAGHELPCNTEMRGQPEKAVPVIRGFFQ